MCNETLIRISEPKKTLNNPKKSWGCPIHNGLNLMRVHEKAISKNNITHEFHLRFMESTFFQFGIKINFSKLFQNNTYMVLMVCHVLKKNEDVIDIIDHKIIQIFIEDIIHHMLKNSMCISKAKGHHNIFKMAIMSSKHHLPIITF
jgi:hypothetical protein